jgi:hypothetical protein
MDASVEVCCQIQCVSRSSKHGKEGATTLAAALGAVCPTKRRHRTHCTHSEAAGDASLKVNPAMHCHKLHYAPAAAIARPPLLLLLLLFGGQWLRLSVSTPTAPSASRPTTCRGTAQHGTAQHGMARSWVGRSRAWHSTSERLCAKHPTTAYRQEQHVGLPEHCQKCQSFEAHCGVW